MFWPHYNNYNNIFVHHTTKTGNWRVSVDNKFLHVITKIVSGGIGETCPVPKACQRVTSVIDSKFLVRSSKREPRILAASQSARWALLHREREDRF